MKIVKSSKLGLDNGKLRTFPSLSGEDTCGSCSVAQINLIIEKLLNLASWKEYWE